jgi:hypothetical protein
MQQPPETMPMPAATMEPRQCDSLVFCVVLIRTGCGGRGLKMPPQKMIQQKNVNVLSRLHI